MKIKIFRIAVSIFVLIALFGNLHAQSTVTPAGGNYQSLQGSISFTVGQVACTTLSNVQGNVQQGVQIAYEIYTDVKENSLIIESYVFPNPTTDFITLKISNYNSDDLYYQLIGQQGEIFFLQKINNGETKLNMINFAAGSYYLKLYNSNNSFKTYKIIKY
jgi:hypothetical protein